MGPDLEVPQPKGSKIHSKRSKPPIVRGCAVYLVRGAVLVEKHGCAVDSVLYASHARILRLLPQKITPQNLGVFQYLEYSMDGGFSVAVYETQEKAIHAHGRSSFRHAQSRA